MKNNDSQFPEIFDCAKVLASTGIIRPYSRAKPMHSVSDFNPAFVNSLFINGYCAYAKMKGIHARIYLRRSHENDITLVSQDGKDQTRKLAEHLRNSLLRLFPGEAMTQVEGFYSLSTKHLYLFDAVAINGNYLYLPFEDRHEHLPRIHSELDIETLPLRSSLSEIRALLANPIGDTEGIVMRKRSGKQPSLDLRFRLPLPP